MFNNYDTTNEIILEETQKAAYEEQCLYDFIHQEQPNEDYFEGINDYIEETMSIWNSHFFRRLEETMFKLSSIKVGMKYQNVRNEIIKSNNLVMSCLPAFCNSNYDVAENLNTKEKVYVLRDYDTGIITDVTTDYYKAVNAETAQRNISEILYNNGYWLEKILWYKQ